MGGVQVPGYSSAEQITLQLVTPDLTSVFWSEAERLLLSHAELWEKDFDLQDIRLRVEAGRFQMWLIADEGGYNLLVLTEIIDFPKRSKLNFLYLMGSRLQAALPLMDCIELWARRRGCTSSLVRGRPGLIRVLPERGYRLSSVELEKDISHMRVN